MENSILGQYQLNVHFISPTTFSFAERLDNSTLYVKPNILLSSELKAICTSSNKF